MRRRNRREVIFNTVNGSGLVSRGRSHSGIALVQSGASGCQARMRIGKLAWRVYQCAAQRLGDLHVIGLTYLRRYPIACTSRAAPCA